MNSRLDQELGPPTPHRVTIDPTVLMEYQPVNLLQYFRAVKTASIGIEAFHVLAVDVLKGLHFLQQHDVIHFE